VLPDRNIYIYTHRRLFGKLLTRPKAFTFRVFLLAQVAASFHWGLLS